MGTYTASAVGLSLLHGHVLELFGLFGGGAAPATTAEPRFCAAGADGAPESCAIADAALAAAAALGEQLQFLHVLQTAAFGAVLGLNLLNLLMRQHQAQRFHCNLLLLFINAVRIREGQEAAPGAWTGVRVHMHAGAWPHASHAAIHQHLPPAMSHLPAMRAAGGRTRHPFTAPPARYCTRLCRLRL